MLFIYNCSVIAQKLIYSNKKYYRKVLISEIMSFIRFNQEIAK